ncbi:MAG: DUF1566 domain-containing protein, partial [Deltaproteobacteria bacterium]|nr:DUF1566 domain-containing protein [Deltaproteobacteria bacterium]
LSSLVDDNRFNPSIDPLFTSSTISPVYWSSTTYAGDTAIAWDVYFLDGGMTYNNKTVNWYVLCVRGQ